MEQHFAAKLPPEVKVGRELAQHRCQKQLSACERPNAAVSLQLLQRREHFNTHQLLPAGQVKEARELVQRSCERQLDDLRAQATSAHDAVHELERTLDRRLAIARWQHAFEVLGTRHRQGHLQSGGHGKGPESLVPKVRCSQTPAVYI